MAANLYAKSVFGEDALVNVSVEKQPDGKLAGYIRIRSKTQGIALSLGDKCAPVAARARPVMGMVEGTSRRAALMEAGIHFSMLRWL